MKFTSRFSFVAALALAVSGAALAQDVTDDATCLDCHDGTERSAPVDPNVPQVHNPEGGFFAEAHEMWACVDCHTYVEEIPHAEDVTEKAVDCLDCHAEVPAK